MPNKVHKIRKSSSGGSDTAGSLYGQNRFQVQSFVSLSRDREVVPAYRHRDAKDAIFEALLDFRRLLGSDPMSVLSRKI
jgi:hypothetical protein